MHNLFPAIGEVNGDRANFRFSDWNGKPNQYGKCRMLVDFKGARCSRPRGRCGQIARAYLYMSQQYGLRLAANSASFTKPGTGSIRLIAGSASATAVSASCRAIPIPSLKSSANNPI
jgi:hypothetical protein